MLSAECFCHSVTKNIKNKCKIITQFLAQDRFIWFTLLSRNIILNMFTNIIQTQWWKNSPIQVYGTVYCLRRLFYMYVFHISCFTTKPLEEKNVTTSFVCFNAFEETEEWETRSFNLAQNTLITAAFRGWFATFIGTNWSWIFRIALRELHSYTLQGAE